MDVEIVDEHESVLPRTEYTLRVTHDGTTPSRDDIKQQAHLHLDEDSDLLIIRNYPATYSGKTFTVKARQYDDEDAMRHLEYDAMLAKNADDTDSTAEEDEDES